MTTPEIQTHVPLGISESHESRHDSKISARTSEISEAGVEALEKN